MNTTAQRIISALQQLEQFLPGHHSASPDYAENVLTGARVAPVPDPSDEGDGLLSVTFPGGHALKVDGRASGKSRLESPERRGVSPR